MSITLRDALYQIPVERQCNLEHNHLPPNNNWEDELIDWVAQRVGQASPIFFTVQQFKKHVGQHALFRLKNHLVNLLKYLYKNHLKNCTLSLSEQVVIAIKLNEGIGNCSDGFLNRVEEVVNRFQRPQSFEGLLYSVRYDIVDKVANQITSEVHARNRVFIRAIDYGVLAINAHDTYFGALDVNQIDLKLKKAFFKEYEFFKILESVKQKFKQEVYLAGYQGPNNSEFGIAGDTLEKIENILFKLLANQPIIDAFLNTRKELAQVEAALNENIPQKEFRNSLIQGLKNYDDDLRRIDSFICNPRFLCNDSASLQALLLWYGQIQVYGEELSLFEFMDPHTHYKKLNILFKSLQKKFDQSKLDLTSRLEQLRIMYGELQDAVYCLLFKRSFNQVLAIHVINDIEWPVIERLINEELISKKYFDLSDDKIKNLLIFLDPFSNYEVGLNMFITLTSNYSQIPDLEVLSLIRHLARDPLNVAEFKKLFDICSLKETNYALYLFSCIKPHLSHFRQLMNYFHHRPVFLAKTIFPKEYDYILSLSMSIDDIVDFVAILEYQKNIEGLSSFLKAFLNYHPEIFTYDLFSYWMSRIIMSAQSLIELLLNYDIRMSLDFQQFNNLLMIIHDTAKPRLLDLIEDCSMHLDSLEKLLFILPQIQSEEIWSRVLLHLPFSFRHLKKLPMFYKDELIMFLKLNLELNNADSLETFEKNLLRLNPQAFMYLVLLPNVFNYIKASSLVTFCINSSLEYKNYPLAEKLIQSLEHLSPFLVIDLLNKVFDNVEDVSFYGCLINQLVFIKDKTDFDSYLSDKKQAHRTQFGFYDALDAYKDFTPASLLGAQTKVVDSLEQVQFDICIQQLKEKHYDLLCRENRPDSWFKKQSRIHNASNVISDLIKRLQYHKFKFMEHQDIQQFKFNCLSVIIEAEPELQKQRGLGVLFSYILLLVHHLKLLLGFDSTLTNSEAVIAPLKKKLMSI